MKNQLKTLNVIITPENKRVPILGNVSASKLVKAPEFSGKIGKTSLLELMRGEKACAKGYSLTTVAMPKIANKLGVESVGTGTIKNRKPMQIFVSANPERGLTEACQTNSDFSRFLTIVYKARKPVEYGQLCASLGWSRAMVSVYAARARDLGFVKTERVSNKIGK